MKSQIHPNWEKVLELANFFQMIELRTNGNAPVNMMATKPLNFTEHTTEEAMCGSPACHAGWFGVFFNDEHSTFSSYSEKMTELVGLPHPNAYLCGFSSGLGVWANNNPKLWGNKNGDEMFSTVMAFGKKDGDVITMQDIATHWYGVAERLYDLQVLRKTV
jgi:hypothetical protein